MKLCCYFNYPPLYRENIYKLIDQNFDAQFYFGREVNSNKKSGIAKLDYKIFKHQPIEFDNKVFWGRFLWRTKLIFLAFKSYDTYIITGDLSISYIPFIFLCKIFKKKTFGWGHGPKTKKGFMSLVLWKILNNMTGYFTYGEKGRQRMIDLGYPHDKVYVIYNSLNSQIKEDDHYTSDIYVNKFKNNNPVIIFIGRLIEAKRIDKLIDLIFKLHKTQRPCNLVLVGDGPCKDELISKSEKLGLIDSIWFYGACYDNTVNAELIYNADVCISPGDVGLTALHSLQFGTPVISHNCFESQGPEYEAIVPYVTGLLFEKNNYDDCYAKTCEWLEFAKGRREEIRKNCFEMINHKWNSDNQIEILRKVLLADQ